MPTAHRCPVKDCHVYVPSNMLACRAHWFWLPEHIRADVWATYRVHGQGSKSHRDAIARAIACLRLAV